MADSGTYSPETIQRRQKIADALLMQATKPREIRHWAQGLGQLGESALAGYEGYRADNEEKTARKDALEQALAAYSGGGGQQPTPTAAPMPMPAPAAQDSQVPIGTTQAPDAGTAPRGIRNNNPLNIEEGAFTQGQPGFAGSDGRFAKFDTPESGMRAANSLLDSYGRRGLNTPAGIIGRWAPAGDGNNVSAYAQAVAKQLGIAPDAQISPEMRPQLIAAMGQHENGRPIGDVAAALQGRPPAGQVPTPPPTAQNAPAGTGGANNEAAMRALMNPWTPPAMAQAIAAKLNPTYGFQTLPDGTILRTDPKSGTVAPIYSAPVKPELKETGSDPITGQKSFQVFDPKTQTMKPVSGPGGGQANAPQSGMLAPGVTEVNHSLSGDDYLKQYGPEVQAAVKAYINGDVMPSGNPRMQSLANTAKTIAQKYGQDMGIPVSDATYSQRRTYRSQLGSNSPSSAGGQAKAFNQGVEHMGHLADTLEKLDNSNGLGIPIIASAVNTGRQAISTDQSAIADKASSIGQTLAGEVGKLFSGSAGGGVHERELTRERFSTVKSKPQLAAALEGTLEMMQGGLTALEQRRDEVMGSNSGIRFINPETQAKIDQIRETISRLKGAVPQKSQSDSAPVEKTIGGKTYIKNGDQWFEK